MSTGVLVLIGYFLCGAAALALFDLATKRLRTNWDKSVVETLSRMSEANVGLSVRACAMLFGAVLWLFWPVVLYGALRDAVGDIINRGRGIGSG